MSAGTFVRDPKDTIVAIASTSRPGHRGIVRISGPKTLGILSSLGFSEADQTWLQNLSTAERKSTKFSAEIFPWHNQPIEVPVDLWVWPNEKTYTGQSSAELHLTGSPSLLDSILQCCIRLGARAAGPGEFTMRAFLAGRLDLVQAEAVLGVIHADNPDQLKLGLQRLGGGLSTPLEQLRDHLVLLLADLEAGLDFVEEDIEFVSNQKLVASLESVHLEIQELVQKVQQRTGHQTKPVVCLVGPPNAGKSSLFNLMVNTDHSAIVSDQAGTTRDFVSGDVYANPLNFSLIDTAGIEDLDFTSDHVPAAPENIDQMAWKQSWQSVRTCDLILFCWPSSESTKSAEFDRWLKKLPAERTKTLLTKTDLISSEEVFKLQKDTLTVSVMENSGLESLGSVIQESLQAQTGRHVDPDGLLGPRANSALSAIEKSIHSALDLAKAQVGEELIAMDLHCAIDELGKLVGTIYTDDLLDSIFSRFCIGK